MIYLMMRILKMETQIKKQIKDYIRSIGGYVATVPGGAYGTNGTPDLIACVNGRFIGIEGKYGDGTQSGWQITRQAQIEAAGGIYLIAYSADYVRTMIETLIL